MWTTRCVAFALMILSASAADAQGIFRFGSSDKPERSRQEAEEESDLLRLSAFRQVSGTRFLVASIHHPFVIKGTFSGVASASQHRTVNYMFFDLADDTATFLLPANRSFILSMEPLPGALLDARDEGKTPPALELASSVVPRATSNVAVDAVRWHLVSYVPADTDGDGQVTAADRKAMAIADAGGQGLVNVILDAGEIFSKTMTDEETLHIIHGSQERQVAVRVNLPTRKVISSTPLPDFQAPSR